MMFLMRRALLAMLLLLPAAQAQAVPGAARVLVDGAGHMPHMERPAAVQAAIERAIAAAARS